MPTTEKGRVLGYVVLAHDNYLSCEE